MSDDQDPGELLESMDNIEDALALLQKSGLNFILYVGNRRKSTLIESKLDVYGIQMLSNWVESGFLNKITLEHLERLK